MVWVCGRGVYCPVCSVQDEEQNQEHEEKGRRRKLDEVTPLIIDPPPVPGVFSKPLGQEKVAMMCCL